MPPPSLQPPAPSFARLAARPLSAISTTTTILERSSSPTPSLSPASAEDYERRLKLVDENRAKLAGSPALGPAFLDLPSAPSPSPSRPTGSPANETVLEFLLASSSNPIPHRLVLGFKARSKVEEVKESIRSHWPTGLFLCTISAIFSIPVHHYSSAPPICPTKTTHEESTLRILPPSQENHD